MSGYALSDCMALDREYSLVRADGVRGETDAAAFAGSLPSLERSAGSGAEALRRVLA